jgi:hypothetical protein
MKAGLMSRSFKFHSKWQPRAAAAGCSGGRMYWDFEVGLWHIASLRYCRLSDSLLPKAVDAVTRL